MSRTLERGPRRTTIAALAAVALLTGSVAAASPGAAATDVSRQPSVTGLGKAMSHDKLGAADRAKLATAKAKGEDTVTAMIVARPGETPRIAREIEAAGGYVRMTDRRLGYLSAAVPTSRLQKVVVADGSVLAVDLDETVRIPKTSATTDGAEVGSYPGPDGSTPDANPYLPTKDTGSVTFKQSHPTWTAAG